MDRVRGLDHVPNFGPCPLKMRLSVRVNGVLDGHESTTALYMDRERAVSVRECLWV